MCASESGQKIPDWLKIQFSIVQAGVVMTHTPLVCDYYSKIHSFFLLVKCVLRSGTFNKSLKEIQS